jgi:hypothetical protein
MSTYKTTGTVVYALYCKAILTVHACYAAILRLLLTCNAVLVRCTMIAMNERRFDITQVC